MAVLSGEDRSLSASALRAALACAEPVYRGVVAARNRAFDAGLRKPVDLGRPTISVGNLTTGGTGKTPMVIELARRLRAMDERPAVLLRGYRAPRHRLGDEEAMLREALGGDYVRAGADRAASAREVLAADPAVSTFILDDGFQHRQVKRDLDLVLVDALEPFGFRHVLPRGLLREGVAGLRRADGVLLTRVDEALPEALEALRQRVASITGVPPVAEARHRWRGLLTIDRERRDEQHDVHRLADARVLAVSAIGNPLAFERTLRAHVREIIAVRRFSDHHDYTRDEAFTLLDEARAAGADAVVMTEKDWVKVRYALGLAPVDPRDFCAPPREVSERAFQGPPMYRPVLAVEFSRGGEASDELLRKAVKGETRDV